MRTNLIQAYLNGSPAAKQYNSDKAAKDFDVHKELNNRTFIKPLPSNGKLVRNNLFDILSFRFLTFPEHQLALQRSKNQV